MSLHSITNKLCLEVPVASPRGMAWLLVQHFPPVMEPGAHAQDTPHVLDMADLLAMRRSHTTNYCNTCMQVNPCVLRVAAPARTTGASRGSSLERRKWSERSDPSCSGSWSQCLLEERQPCLIPYPPASRLVWWVKCYGATRKGSSGLDELPGRTTNWMALKWPQHFSVL